MLNRVTEKLVAAVRNLAATMLLLGLLLNFANVVGRYFFDAPIEWAEEVMLFLMVAIVFLGASYVSWKGRQIAMDLLVLMLPPAPQKVVRVLALVVEVVVPLIVVWIGTPVIVTLWNFDQRSQAADLPLAIPQSLIPIGLFLVALVTMIRIAVLLVTPNAPFGPASADEMAALR